jgi:hypothetical protein
MENNPSYLFLFPPDLLTRFKLSFIITIGGRPLTRGGNSWNSMSSYRSPTRALGRVAVQPARVKKGDNWTRSRSWANTSVSRTQWAFWSRQRSSTNSPDFSFSESSRPNLGVRTCGIHYREVSMTAQEDGYRRSTLRISYKTLSFIYSSANRAYTILRIFQRVIAEDSFLIRECFTRQKRYVLKRLVWHPLRAACGFCNILMRGEPGFFFFNCSTV